MKDLKEHIKIYINDVEGYGISKGRVKELAEIIHKGKNVSFGGLWDKSGYQAVRSAQNYKFSFNDWKYGKPGTEQIHNRTM
ncbi:MAG: hypothetical protein ACLTGX_02305 [Clostridium sp.]